MGLPLFFRKLIAPVEVKLVLSAISQEAQQLQEEPNKALGAGIAIQIVMAKVVADALNWSKSIKADIHNGKPPRVIALFMLMNVARDYLASGRFHVYRGKLSMQGQALKGMNYHCLDQLAKLGQFTSEEKSEALKATNEDIAAVG